MNILIYADFNKISIISAFIKSNSRKIYLKEVASRYSFEKFKQDYLKITGFEEFKSSDEGKFHIYTNLLEESDFFQRLKTIQGFIPETTKTVGLDYYPTMSRGHCLETFVKLSDLIASKLIIFPDSISESKVTGYMETTRKDDNLKSEIIPYLYFAEYCTENILTVWD